MSKALFSQTRGGGGYSLDVVSVSTDTSTIVEAAMESIHEALGYVGIDPERKLSRMYAALTSGTE